MHSSSPFPEKILYHIFYADWFKKLHAFIFIPFYISRSTAELENFQNLILMYASKRYAYEPPVYRARNLLAALDYNQHVNRGIRISQDGNQGYAFSNFRSLTAFLNACCSSQLLACKFPLIVSAVISTLASVVELVLITLKP